jgi:hypothetical protein
LSHDIEASKLRLRQFGLRRNMASQRIVERHENDFIHSIVAGVQSANNSNWATDEHAEASKNYFLE